MAAVSEEKINKTIKRLLKEMGPLPGRMSELLEQHRGRRVTAANDPQLRSLEFIQAELSGMVASLRQFLSSELGPDYVHNGDFKKWLFALSQVVPTIRDYLDKSEEAARCGCHAQLHRAAPHYFFRAAGLPARFPHGVKDMEETLSGAASGYRHLLLADDGDRSASTTSYTCADAGGISLVGVEDALRNKVVSRFMDDGDDNMNLKGISIVGPAGVGKTTLAKVIFSKLQDGGHYGATAKVEASQRPDMKEILRNILSQIRLLEITTFRDEQELPMLVDEIRTYLKDRRYLIVIDDLWKKPDWDVIKDAFPQNNMGSRIIVTTSIQSVAKTCCFIGRYPLGDVHEVNPLSERDSKVLFSKTFDSEVSCPNHLQQVCCEILKRCDGIPLFISGMAAWLKEEEGPEQQLKVPPMLKQFERTLSTTYDDLPYWLKVQLLYISMFPQGYMFEKNSFSEKLDAELLADSSTSAEDYFWELVDRNIIIRVKNSQVEEESCHWQVNYFMLQFLASKSADKGFVYTSGTLTSVAGAASESSSGGAGKKPRRLSLHQADPQLVALLAEMGLSHTRSLAVSGAVDRIPLDKFILLMVLDLEGWQCFKEQYWLSICKMFLLRYLSLRNVNTGDSKLPPKIKELCKLETLDLSHTEITEIPSQVCELSELRMLDLRGTPVRQLPEQIRKMRQLRHLLLGGNGVDLLNARATKVPEEIGNLYDLHTLAIDLSECSASLLEALGRIWKLRVLVITLSPHQATDGKFQEALCSSIEKWKDFESLTIHCGLGYSMEFLGSHLSTLSVSLKKFKVSGGRFFILPSWLGKLDRLASVQIAVYKLVPDDLSTLGKLERLERLVLGLHLLPEEAIVIDGGSLFPKLQRLSVGCRVPWMTFKQGAMPMLTCLELNIGGSPASEKSVPSGIIHLRSLSEVVLNYSECYDDSANVRATVEAVKRGVAEHRKMINLFINGTSQQVDDVQAAEEDPARATGVNSETEVAG